MTYEECELAILRMQVDQAQEKMAKRVVQSPEIKRLFEIVEQFLRKKHLVCYGGIAINALLPIEDKIYDDDVDLPDYDFFSPDALNDAKELSNIFYQKGYTEVEAKSGQHHGTYKVFVNFLPIADITYSPKPLFRVIKANAMKVNGILYTDPNFLKMSMFLELSRPSGDTSRWEKVLKRLMLINKAYPLRNEECKHVDFQRAFAGGDSLTSNETSTPSMVTLSTTNKTSPSAEKKALSEDIYETVKETFIHQGVVFFGGYAISQYAQYMPKTIQKKVEHIPDFDVLSKDPLTTAEIVKERLEDIGISNVKIVKREPIGEVIPLHYEIKVGKNTIAFVYQPVACHSYNVLIQNGEKVKIATIDTMLSFYLAFLYADRPYYDPERILCMSQFLFDVQRKNRLEQKGLLKRFSIICYGHQESVEEMRAHKAKKYKELSAKRGTKEFEEWFLNYRPGGTKVLTKTMKKTVKGGLRGFLKKTRRSRK
jgi:hypothetical protein